MQSQDTNSTKSLLRLKASLSTDGDSRSSPFTSNKENMAFTDHKSNSDSKERMDRFVWIKLSSLAALATIIRQTEHVQ